MAGPELQRAKRRAAVPTNSPAADPWPGGLILYELLRGNLAYYPSPAPGAHWRGRGDRPC